MGKRIVAPKCPERIVAPKCPEQELRKKRKVGAEGFEPPSAGFHYGGSYPPRNQ